MSGRATRSRVTLPDAISQVPQESPMKQARRARTAAMSTSSELAEHSEDELLLSPDKRATSSRRQVSGKRSASPGGDNGSSNGANEVGRESKRVKRESGESDSQKQRGTRPTHKRTLSDPSLSPSKAPKKQPAILSEVGTSFIEQSLDPEGSLPQADNGRARSVPAFPNTYILPHIDLAKLPPSPTRRPRSREPSRSKSSTPKMRIQPLPAASSRLASIADEDDHDMDVDEESRAGGTLEAPLEESSSNTLVNPFEPMSPKDDIPPPTETEDARSIHETPAVAAMFEDVGPMSPLTPAPPTPFPPKAVMKAARTEQKSKLSTEIVPKEAKATTKPKPETSAQVEKRSRLPRLATTSRSMALDQVPAGTTTSKPSGSNLQMRGAGKGQSTQNAFSVLMSNRESKDKSKGEGKYARAVPSKATAMLNKAKTFISDTGVPGRVKGKGKEMAAGNAGHAKLRGLKGKMKGKAKVESNAAPSLVPILPSDEEDSAEEVKNATTDADTLYSPHVLHSDGPVTVSQVEQHTLDDIPSIPSVASQELIPNEHVPEETPTPAEASKVDAIPFLDEATVTEVHNDTTAMEMSEPLTPLSDLPTDMEMDFEIPIHPMSPLPTPRGEASAEPDVATDPPCVNDENVAAALPEGSQTVVKPSQSKEPAKSAVSSKKRAHVSIPKAGATALRVTRSTSTKKPSVKGPEAGPSKPKQTTLNFPRTASRKRKSVGSDPVTTETPEMVDGSANINESNSVNPTTFEDLPAAPQTPMIERKAQPKWSPLKVDDSSVRRSPRNLHTSKSTPSLRITPNSSPVKSRTPLRLTSPSPNRRGRSASPSPTKRIVRSASMLSNSANLSENRFAKNGALTGLSSALEQLRMPAPSRPNTSMGFNRDKGGDSDDDSLPTKPRTQSQDDSAIGKKATGSTIVKGASVSRAVTLGSSQLTRKGIIGAGSSKGPFGGGRATGRPPFGIGAGLGIGGPPGRRAPKASRNPGLPMVVGSPVKGGGNSDAMVEFEEANDAANRQASLWSRLQGSAVEDEDMEVEVRDRALSSASGKGKERESDSSRRVSMASLNLQHSLASFRAEAANEAAASKGLMGPPPIPASVRSVSNGTDAESSDTPPGRRSTRTAAAAASQLIANVAASSRRAPAPEPSADDAIKFLKDCVVFVDVKTEDGDEAGSLFVQMLEVAGARVLQRVGQSCTHIIYKNGMQGTVSRYKMLRDPKPLVVGIAWVVECVEQHIKVDEKKHLIDLDELSLFTNPSKRRRSMLPKLISRDPSDGNESNRDESHDGDVSMDGSNSSMILDDLTPLERARSRRKSVLPAPLG